MKKEGSVLTLDAPKVSVREILRYARSGEDDLTTRATAERLLRELDGILQYKLVYLRLPTSVDGKICKIGACSVQSSSLAKALSQCNEVLLLATTIGLAFDRLLARYSALHPADAIILQAIGAERIEALCDHFCDEYAMIHGCKLRPRFSPGYGDLPLQIQSELLSILDAERKIGIFLTDSCLMLPSKSVTAFVGIEKQE